MPSSSSVSAAWCITSQSLREPITTATGVPTPPSLPAVTPPAGATVALRSAAVRAGDTFGNGQARAPWTFFTNHLHVLLCIARDPTIRLRDVATFVGITERAAQGIVADLVEAGY